ncbi:3-phosphoshikimate 1-carboxyvinyltransferase [Candidatus Zinderia insecticola CARI]|uniref:3-phosphoshikimate 1-carboxyvinyltransferase n=1 Tax=Zinderia insecticola (strain CARI) TaxID=871271 RepID=E0TIN5_ZINIC|nr:3-phosphoshikimate 1-carboxyvinyltransferase [Candidatus Zinderia insecticola CARI]
MNNKNFILLKKKNNISGKINIPGSKSISNRILLISALSLGITKIKNLLISDDTLIMIKCLKKLGIKIKKKKKIFFVYGNFIKFLKKNVKLFVDNAGTLIRPLTSILSFMKGNYILYGSKRMNKRPIKDLVSSLNNIGMRIKYLKNNGFPPLLIKKGKIKTNIIKIKSNISSQYLTSILISSVLINKFKEIIIITNNNIVSNSYINITINLMKLFKVNVIKINNNVFKIITKEKYISPGIVKIEGDLTSASYFLASSVISKGPLKIKGIIKNSIQGDVKFLDILEDMGAKINYQDNELEIYYNKIIKNFNIDCINFPDLAMTLLMLSLYSNNISLFKNLYSWNFKETNRLNAMKKELNKIGAKINIINRNDILVIPPKYIKSAFINTYNDHRIAMCFSLLSLNNINKLGSNILIENPKCVFKTFPNYFKLFKKISK